VFDDGDGSDLLAARLFVLDPTPEDLRGYVERPGEEWARRFREARRLSLGEVQERDDAVRREDRRSPSGASCCAAFSGAARAGGT